MEKSKNSGSIRLHLQWNFYKNKIENISSPSMPLTMFGFKDIIDGEQAKCVAQAEQHHHKALYSVPKDFSERFASIITECENNITLKQK